MAYKSLPLALAFGRLGTAPWVAKPSGLELVPDGGCIVAGNHQSFIDGPALGAAFGRWLARPLHMIAYDTPFNHWLMAWFLRSSRCLPLPRADRDGAERTMRQALFCLNNGGAVGIFPEGHLTPGPRMGTPRVGLAVLALESGAPVVPVGLTGSEAVLPMGAGFPRLGRRMGIAFGAPLDFSALAAGYAAAPPAERHARLRQVLAATCEAIAALSGKRWEREAE